MSSSVMPPPLTVPLPPPQPTPTAGSAAQTPGPSSSPATEITAPTATTDAEDIPAHRPFNPPSTWGVAVYARSSQFKLHPARGTGRPAADFRARFSRDARAHGPNWLKGIARYFTNPELLSLCGGLPSSDFFPFPSIRVEFNRPGAGRRERESRSGGGGGAAAAAGVAAVPEGGEGERRAQSETENGVEKEKKIEEKDGAGKHPADTGVITNAIPNHPSGFVPAPDKTVFQMATALNYGQGAGSSQMLRFVTEHTELVHAPQYSDWACTITIGSTSSTDILLRLFADPGDSVLVEQYGFPAALQAIRSQQLRPVGVLMDGEGVLPESLDGIMNHWTGPGTRPRVLYLVPSGQNPTGATMGLQRRREVYAVARKHDLVILEDEPYYFLQMDPPRGQAGASEQPQQQLEEQEDFPDDDARRRAVRKRFLAKLVPSFLSMDPDGRVIRLDSFSKVVAPGSRCGWITGPEHVIEQYQKYSDLATQGPAGWSQMILFQLLDEKWGHGGYLDWLIELRDGYAARRQVILDACDRYLRMEKAGRRVVSWVTPQAGMFLWLRIDGGLHPSRTPDGTDKDPASTEEIETEIFDVARDKHAVLILRGSYFLADDAPGQAPLREASPDEICVRLTYASHSPELIWESIRRLGCAVRDVFGLEEEGESESEK